MKNGLIFGASVALMGAVFFGAPVVERNIVDGKILSALKESANDPESVILYPESRTENDNGDVCHFFNAKNAFGGYFDMMTVVRIKDTGVVYWGPNGDNRDMDNPNHVEFGELVEKHCS